VSSEASAVDVGLVSMLAPLDVLFELNPAQVDQMVNELFRPWQHLTLSRSYFLLSLCTVFTNFFL
jgi:hypothetical protein